MVGQDAEPQTTEEAVAAVLGRMSAAPSYSLVLYRTLCYCETPRTIEQIEREMLSYPEMETPVYAPAVLLGWLEETGGLGRVVAEGQEDHWQTTKAGSRAAELEAPARRLRELLDSQPLYRDIFVSILRFCTTPRTRAEVEALLRDSPVLQKPRVYASYFVQELEQAGGLTWSGKWQTSEAGQGVTG